MTADQEQRTMSSGERDSGVGRGFSILLWVGVFLGAVVGTFFLIDGLIGSDGAPQQAAAFAGAAAFAIVPYVTARAFDKIRGR